MLQLAAGKPAVDFMASDKLATPQIADFVRAAAGWLKQPHLAEPAPGTWEAALRLVIGAAAPRGKLVLILDEFQWLCKSSPERPSILQRLWDLEWQRENRLMLVLCGLLIGFMEREILGAKYSPRIFRDRRLLSAGAGFLLREELAEVRQAAAILETIAGGRRTQGDIARAVGLGTSALAPHLKNLTGLGYLERVFPLTAKSPPRPAVHYRVTDPLLRFWFRFIEPHWSLLRRQDPRRTFDEIVIPQWDAFCGDGFERLCRDAMPFLYESEGVTGRYEIGEYWVRQTQIDVVGIHADGWTDLGECKWSGRGNCAGGWRAIRIEEGRLMAVSSCVPSFTPLPTGSRSTTSRISTETHDNTWRQ